MRILLRPVTIPMIKIMLSWCNWIDLGIWMAIMLISARIVPILMMIVVVV